MVEIIGVRFKRAGKIYHFNPDGMNIPVGENIIVETSRGIEFGRVETPIREVPEEDVFQPLKKVIRVATSEDIEQHRINKIKEEDAFNICAEKITAHNLAMKLVNVEITFDLNKIIFYFTADGRIDFRELVKDLAGVFKTRIELRQIGVRDEAKMMNSIGVCGRSLCCAAFLGEFQPVSIKMAKEQNLSLNPTKISGICSRLMCCLKYEEETYECLNRNLPREGDYISTPDGNGTVLAVNVLRQLIKAGVRKKPSDDPKIGYYPVEDIRIIKSHIEPENEIKLDKELKNILD